LITVTLRCSYGKALLVLLATCVCLWALSKASLAQEGNIYLRFTEHAFTARIEDAPLETVLDRIKEERDIWFQVWSGGSLEGEKISVTFSELSIQDGLERILSSMNHSLFFDEAGVVGVMLLGKADKTGRSRRTPTPRRTPPRSTRRR
jgi:hypothetical protein